ncbi:rod shape-determining protein RodA [Bailinhaonella thermotolerans]|uniref:Peptidoglycan glycosyltransferase RodA n=1 Tax=Bailinhaonella thermotolerans TaxID=1070861 RepID=A0A3A4AZH8_9ACTN|nr:rod shape-determining protein RodA [Bailinhaonella thermotolerans]RJL34533.1 rod shape-determining protein RodA [Bailinhaonella thermotolerans]
MTSLTRSPSLARRVAGVASPVWRMDGWLLAAVAALTVIGTLLVWSSTRASLAGAPSGLLQRHLLNLCIGLGLGGAIAMVDHRWLRAYAPLLYALAMLGLLLVLTPAGETINGSHSWIVIGGAFQFQPSEFAKPALVLGLALLLAEVREDDVRPRDFDVWLALGIAAIPMGLVMLQPDLGTTLVLVAITAGVLILSGVRMRWIAGLAGVAVVAAVIVWQFQLLEAYQVNRFMAFIDPSLDPRGAGYNSRQALITIGSGEVFGKGLFNGGQTTGKFVPEQHTDFVFTVAGEELGFVGAAAIVGLLGVVLLRGLKIARECEDRFGALVASGIVCWLAFQMFINVGMTIGIMPITGLPLPFVSYGGTATFANFIAIGLLQAIHIRERSYG